MVTDTLKQIENINASLQWIKQYRPEHYESRFLQLVEERRKLMRIAETEQDNPAIAAYGVSQVGKSYLINCLLQKNGKPFLLESEEKTYNFIEEMNPKTDNTEATGVVTRFTSFSQNPQLYCKKYPILMRCLSVTDVILIICDGYYHDINDFTTYSESEITSIANDIYEKYKGNAENYQSAVQADDLLTIKAYFSKYNNNAQAFLHTSFFDQVALVINRIPSSDWVDVFSILWSRNPYQTRLFTKMLSTLAKFKYAKYVYLPPQALLHNGVNEATVMSVQCLNELFLDNLDADRYTDVYLRQGEDYDKLSNMTKSEVCAVCAEIIVKIGNEYLENTNRYFFDDIDPKIASQLTTGDVKMEILKHNDMLDFPGARSRKKLQLDTMSEDSILTTVLLRGKVAYLFNMYNESKRINILLYCHHQEKNEVSEIPLLLRDWIMNNVGQTMEMRKETLRLTENISPLFYIGTKFNIDMSPKTEDIANEENALKGRWQQRFHKVLYSECFNSDGSLDMEEQKIFLNWTRKDEHFTNSYVLRDYKFSSSKASKLYDDERTPRSHMLMDREYYTLMRETFINSEHVKCFFSNPELSWDVCASINNDGSLYIIENLFKIAIKMGEARKTRFGNDVKTSAAKIRQLMSGYYISDDISEILQENISKANGIFRELEFTCQSEPEFFGHLIQALQMTEAESFKELHKLLPTLTSTVYDSNSIKDYELIRKRCNNFAGLTSEDAKWKSFMAQYHFSTQEEAAEFLRRRNIDVQKLFQGDTIKRKNSAVISNHLMTLWEKKINSMQMTNMFTGAEHMDEIVMSDLVSCIINTSVNINLMNHIESDIADYVDVLNISTINEDLIADMIATTISDFITNFGYDYLTPEQITNSQRVAREYNLPCFNWIEKERKEEYDEDEMTELFNDILSSSNHYTPAYEANYNSWLEYLYIAYISHLNIPDYNKEENDKLKMILDALK